MRRLPADMRQLFSVGTRLQLSALEEARSKNWLRPGNRDAPRTGLQHDGKHRGMAVFIA
jgi:hypothetical protein